METPQPSPLPAAVSETPLIELEHVVKRYKTPAGEFTALKDVSLGFAAGQFTSIMGKSGSGKSTLINMITGIDHPTSGEVRVGEARLRRMKEGQMAVWRGRTIGVVFQFFQLLPTLTVLENTLLPMDYAGVYPQGERETHARRLLEALGIAGMADKLPAALSSGQQQVAAIARALANDPPIIVADEPTGNLDSSTEKQVLDIFAELAGRGKTILIVTHDPALARRSQRRVLICDGELVDEWVAQALPGLSHPLLLEITRQAGRRLYAPGQVLARRGTLDAGLTVLTRGAVQVMVERRGRPVELVATLCPGQHFSQFDLLETPQAGLCFRAAPEEPVEALCLEVEPLNRLVRGAQPLEEALRRAAARWGTGSPLAPAQPRLSFWRRR